MFIIIFLCGARFILADYDLLCEGTCKKLLTLIALKILINSVFGGKYEIVVILFNMHYIFERNRDSICNEITLTDFSRFFVNGAEYISFPYNTIIIVFALLIMKRDGNTDYDNIRNKMLNWLKAFEIIAISMYTFINPNASFILITIFSETFLYAIDEIIVLIILNSDY